MKDIELKTIEKENSAEIVEKKSRFIANIYNVESKEEAEEKIKQIKTTNKIKIIEYVIIIPKLYNKYGYMLTIYIKIYKI